MLALVHIDRLHLASQPKWRLERDGPTESLFSVDLLARDLRKCSATSVTEAAGISPSLPIRVNYLLLQPSIESRQNSGSVLRLDRRKNNCNRLWVLGPQ